MSAVVYKKRAMLSSSFTKQLAIANINLANDFLEEVKHHWGSFSVHEMLQ
jgi:phosphosulfolactate synthase (CoM biosynthesis protein A)